MKLADYVIVGVILIWFCIAVWIIIKNRGGCSCGAGAGRNCSGCGACQAGGKGCSRCGICQAGGKGCSGCSACKEGRRKGNTAKYGMEKEENRMAGCPACGMTGRNRKGEIDSGSGAGEE